MSVALSEVIRAARAHRAPLAGESVGYLVLAIADQVLTAPRLVQAADIQLSEDGALRVVSGHASSDADAELSLRQTLNRLLHVASSGSAALTRASRRSTPLGLSSLVRELEAALIPVNRSAARRALSRVHRETARALDSGTLPEDEESQSAPPAATVAAPQPAAAVAPAATLAAASQPAAAVAPAAAPPAVLPCEPNPEPELVPDLDQELETPPLVAVGMPLFAESRLDGVVSALCEQMLASPQFVESDALTSALAVRAVTVPAGVSETEPEFLLDVDVEFETDAVDSSAAPTVMRALDVEPVASPALDSSTELPSVEFALEARTRPEPVVLRKTLGPVLEPLPRPIVGELLHETPTLGTLAAQLPILEPEQIAQMEVLASVAAALEQSLLESHERTERTPEVLPLAPGVAMVESRKSDVNELLQSFQVAEPNINSGLCRAIKEMADLDLTPAPFAALIR